MNTPTSFFIGIDVSKPFFDAALLPVINHQKQAIVTAHFDNTETGLKQFGKWLSTNKVVLTDAYVVMENTGIYHRLLWAWCNEKNLTVHIGNAAAGVVPFGHRSGTSIRGRDKVHPMANKELKKMLHLGALSAIQHSEEMKQYYERKKAEGKHSMSVLNAIRNKIVLRAVAVSSKQIPYQENLKNAA